MDTHGNTILLVIILILLAEAAWDFILGELNRRSWGKEVPARLKDVYPGEKFLKQKQYRVVNHKLNLISTSLSLVLLLVVLWFEGFARVDSITYSITTNWLLHPLLFFAFIGIVSYIISLPFSVYGTFVIEQQFGFNTSTPAIFISDQVKSMVIGALLGGILLSLVIWFYHFAGHMFWFYSWVGISLVMLLINKFYTTLILPLFNKMEPLYAGELRASIELLCDKCGFRMENVFVMDGSKRSTKANAFFSGFGRQKRVVLYDTLIKELSTPEIVAVLAHEIGHYKSRHIARGTVTAILQTGLTLFLLGWFVNNPGIAQALGVNNPSFHIGLVGFGMLYSPASSFFGLLGGIQSRRHEFQADAYAAKWTGPDALKSALKKISAASLDNPTPHPWYVFFNYSHPPLLKRLDALDKL